MWGRAGSLRGGWLPPPSGANAASGRLTIGRSLPSCPTKAPLPCVHIRSDSSRFADESPRRPLLCRAPTAHTTQGGRSVHFATIPRKVKLPAEQQNSRLMRAMFSIVAPRYDFITRAFSYGMDRHWKRTGLDRANLRDLGTLPMIRF